MSIQAGTHKLGPENGTLSVRTGRTGAAAKAGHDLLIHVTAWQATLDVGENPAQTSIVLDADATSLRVREGTGGMQALGDDDKASIQQTIDDEVLKRQDIEFRSTAVQTAADGSRISVHGELTLLGKSCPIAFDVTVGDDGKLSGSAVVKQTDWGITPYSTLFGALKVADEVEVVINASCRRADPSHVAEEPEWSAPWEVGSRPAPIIAPGVSSFLWALVFFLYLWFGMAAVGVSHGTALPLALVASFFIFLFVRTQGVGRKQT
jgi:polyisoprenoid-binding protein YceI